MNVEAIMTAASVWVIPVLLAVTLHEAAHGWAAWRLGDDTAYRMGRVSFNPFRHIDLFGTVLLPAMLLFFSAGRMMFGFAKPVPVNFLRLGRLRRDMVLVALAGPGTNLFLAAVSAALFHVLPFVSGEVQQWFGSNLMNSVWINLLLCVFNMLPLPPLDGGRVAVGLLPPFLATPLARLERVGIVIVMTAVFILPWIGAKLSLDLNIFWWLVIEPALYLRGLIFAGLGFG